MLKFLRLGLWNDGQVLRVSARGLRDRKIIAGDYAIVWGVTLLFLLVMSLHELLRDQPAFLALLTAILAAALPIAWVLPVLRRWNARLSARLEKIERQLEVLRGWREPDAIQVVKEWTADVRVARRRGALAWLVKWLRVRWRLRFRRRVVA